MRKGSSATDGGFLLMDPDEADNIKVELGESSSLVREFIGSKELLKAQKRYCLWIQSDEVGLATQSEAIRTRLKNVRAYRLSSRDKAVKARADEPYRFMYPRHEERPALVVPRHSSERRNYVPMALLGADQISSDANCVCFGADAVLFPLLQSSMHMAWVRTVGGRMKSDYRYSNTLCYNTFPFPNLDDSMRVGLDDRAFGILAARERWPDRSLAELYDPDKTPANLRAAHDENDSYVDSLYRKKPFESDADRMELLLSLYRDLVAEDEAKNSKSKKKG